MARLLVHVEGQTEEEFVNQLLADHLRPFGYESVSARLMGNARSRSKRGGIKGWDSAKREILRHLNSDGGLLVTTMVDYYGLPESGNGAWPGRANANTRPHLEKSVAIEKALIHDIAVAMSDDYHARRFIPFIFMHEFEAVLFSDCELFAQEIGQPQLSPAFQTIRNQFATPEEINDSPQSAPSKRITALLPGYEKPFHGVLAALGIGLPAMRAACPHFNEWLVCLESIPSNNAPS